MSENFYQAPAVAEVTAPETDAERTRRMYLTHEANVKGVGSLYVLGGVLGIIGLLMVTVFAVPTASSHDSVGLGGQEIMIFVMMGALGVLQLIGGLGLRKLTKTGRVIGIVTSAIGLIGFPIGTLISAFILYLLLGAKGKVVFSPEYKEVIAQTPHIRYRTSKWVWIILLLIVLIIVGVVVLAFFSSPVPTPT